MIFTRILRIFAGTLRTVVGFSMIVAGSLRIVAGTSLIFARLSKILESYRWESSRPPLRSTCRSSQMFENLSMIFTRIKVVNYEKLKIIFLAFHFVCATWLSCSYYMYICLITPHFIKMPAVVQSVITTNRHSRHAPYVLSGDGKIVNAAKIKDY